MKVWRRAVGILKDKKSIWLARAVGRSASRNPDLEEAVVRATDHGELSFDYRNAGRVFLWLRTSPSFLRPLLSALCRRTRRTRSWPVALKCLVLVHGVLSSGRRIGPLPFDFSAFVDPAAPWGYTAFVRAYFAALDQKAAAVEEAAGFELLRSQLLLDLLARVRPVDGAVRGPLIAEAMGCVAVEILSLWSVVRSALRRTPARIPADGGAVRKAAAQERRLAAYMELCRELGVENARELPAMESAGGGFAGGDDRNRRGEREGFQTVVTFKWERFDGRSTGDE